MLILTRNQNETIVIDDAGLDRNTIPNLEPGPYAPS